MRTDAHELEKLGLRAVVRPARESIPTPSRRVPSKSAFSLCGSRGQVGPEEVRGRQKRTVPSPRVRLKATGAPLQLTGGSF